LTLVFVVRHRLSAFVKPTGSLRDPKQMPPLALRYDYCFPPRAELPRLRIPQGALRPTHLHNLSLKIPTACSYRRSNPGDCHWKQSWIRNITSYCVPSWGCCSARRQTKRDCIIESGWKRSRGLHVTSSIACLHFVINHVFLA